MASTTAIDESETDLIVKELVTSYWMELETVQNYLANSVNLVGVRAERIKDSLEADITEELGHAQQLAKRIHVIGGRVPGSKKFPAAQENLQPPDDPSDVVTVIRGVIEAETGAMKQYIKIIKLCEGKDYATQDLCIKLLADEEQHRRDFLGYLVEYEK